MEKLNFEQMECVKAGASDGVCALLIIGGITSCFSSIVTSWGGITFGATLFQQAYSSGCFEATY